MPKKSSTKIFNEIKKFGGFMKTILKKSILIAAIVACISAPISYGVIPDFFESLLNFESLKQITNTFNKNPIRTLVLVGGVSMLYGTGIAGIHYIMPKKPDSLIACAHNDFGDYKEALWSRCISDDSLKHHTKEFLQSPHGIEALHIVLEENHQKFIQHFIENLDVNVVKTISEQLEDKLMWAALKSDESAVAHYKSLIYSFSFYRGFFDPNNEHKQSLEDIFIKACVDGNHDAALTAAYGMLNNSSDKKIDINALSTNNLTFQNESLLHHAARKYYDIAKLLITLRHKLTILNREGLTPLQVAEKSRTSTTISLLQKITQHELRTRVRCILEKVTSDNPDRNECLRDEAPLIMSFLGNNDL